MTKLNNWITITILWHRGTLLTLVLVKPHNASGKYPTMHHFVTEMCTHVHISDTKWYIVGYGTGAVWDLWDESIWWHQPITSTYVSYHHLLTWTQNKNNLIWENAFESDVCTISSYFLLASICWLAHRKVWVKSVVSESTDVKYILNIKSPEASISFSGIYFSGLYLHQLFEVSYLNVASLKCNDAFINRHFISCF